jgi:hypothetical protein
MLPVPPKDENLVDDRFWLIGWIVVVDEPEDWDVLYDPVTDEGRLRAKHWAYAVARDVYRGSRRTVAV